MSLIDDRDKSREMRGAGYRFGFAGHDIAAAIKMLKEGEIVDDIYDTQTQSL